VADLASEKKLDEEFLRNLGVRDLPGRRVAISYGEGVRERYRSTANGERKMWWQGDGDIIPYGRHIPGLLERAREVGALWLVEGESDVWVLWNANFPAVGVPGSNMAGKLDEVDFDGISRLYVVREPDDGGTRFVTGVAERIAELFPETPPEIRAVDMPDGLKDPADLWVECSGDSDRYVDALRACEDGSEEIELPEPPGPPPLIVRPLREAFENPPVTPEPLVEGLILPGDRVVIGGARGAQKTWLLMAAALQMAQGEGLMLGRFSVARPARVLFCHGELPDDGTTFARWEKLVDPDVVPEELYETFTQWRVRLVKRRDSVRDKGGTFTTEWTDADLDRTLIDALDEYQPDVLVLDPWRVFFAGEENSNTETEAALDRIAQVASGYGITTLMSHHFSQARQGADPEDWWRGASRLGDWASVRITLQPAYSEKEWKRQGMSRQQARRYATARFLLRRLETPDDFGVRFDPASGLWVPWTPPATGAASRRKTIGPAIVAKKLHAAGGHWASTRIAARALGVSQEKAKAILEEAERDGVVVRFEGPRSAIGWRLHGDWA
jgi:hypothetical protein